MSLKGQGVQTLKERCSYTIESIFSVKELLCDLKSQNN